MFLRAPAGRSCSLCCHGAGGAECGAGVSIDDLASVLNGGGRNASDTHGRDAGAVWPGEVAITDATPTALLDTDVRVATGKRPLPLPIPSIPPSTAPLILLAVGPPVVVGPRSVAAPPPTFDATAAWPRMAEATCREATDTASNGQRGGLAATAECEGSSLARTGVPAASSAWDVAQTDVERAEGTACLPNAGKTEDAAGRREAVAAPMASPIAGATRRQPPSAVRMLGRTQVWGGHW